MASRDLYSSPLKGLVRGQGEQAPEGDAAGAARRKLLTVRCVADNQGGDRKVLHLPPALRNWAQTRRSSWCLPSLQIQQEEGQNWGDALTVLLV